MLAEAKAIEHKQQKRWQDLLKAKPTPLLDDALSLGPNDIPNKQRWKKLVQVAAFIDYHVQREGSERDMPGTHTAYLAAYHELRKEYLGKR